MRAARWDKMNTILGTLASWLMLLALGPISLAQVHQDTGIRVRVAIYEVPSMFVSMTFAVKNADGSVWGTTIGGANTTSSFPEGVVLLQDILRNDFSDSEVIEEISKFMAAPCIVPQQIDARLLAYHDFQFNETLESREEARDLKARGVEYHYRLRVAPGEQSGDKLPVQVQLWMNRNDPRQVHFPWEGNVERQILDYSIAVTVPGAEEAYRPDSTPGGVSAQIAEHPAGGILIGIASHDNDSRPRGTVYWLAISVANR